MLKSLSPLNRKKVSDRRPFKDYYSEWINTLKTTLLPQLRHHMATSATPNLLSAHVAIIHHHLQCYYQTLDFAASDDVSQVLFPAEYRNPLELPFLWLGDLHPYLFTNLLRSFILQNEEEPEQQEPEIEDEEDDQEQEEEEEDYDDEEEKIEVGESCEFLRKQWPLMNAWKVHLRRLTVRIDEIERGLRLMVPALMDRTRKAQEEFVHRVGSGEMPAAEAAAEMEREMVAIVMDANRLRKDVISEIVNATSVYQGALFLEGLAQFLVGFQDGKLLDEFKRCKLPINP